MRKAVTTCDDAAVEAFHALAENILFRQADTERGLNHNGTRRHRTAAPTFRDTHNGPCVVPTRFLGTVIGVTIGLCARPLKSAKQNELG